MNFLILLAIGGLATPSPTPGHGSFASFLCHFLGLDERAYPAITQVRATVDWRGHKLVSFDLESNQRQELWVNDGLHSPAVIAEKGIVVLRTCDPTQGSQSKRDDGLWLIPVNQAGEPRQIAAGSFVDIVGVSDHLPKILVIGAAQVSNGGLPFWPLIQIEFRESGNDVQTSELMRVTSADLGAIRGGQILDGKFITEWTATDGSPTNRLKVAKLPIENSTTYQPIKLPTEKAIFHPVWVNKDTIACIEQ
jgi:hypothetical protein